MPPLLPTKNPLAAPVPVDEPWNIAAASFAPYTVTLEAVTVLVPTSTPPPESMRSVSVDDGSVSNLISEPEIIRAPVPPSTILEWYWLWYICKSPLAPNFNLLIEAFPSDPSPRTIFFDVSISPAKVVTPAMLTLSKFVCPSTSKSKGIVAPPCKVTNPLLSEAKDNILMILPPSFPCIATAPLLTSFAMISPELPPP